MWLGPGSIAALVLVVICLGALGIDPERSSSGCLLLGVAMVMVLFGHTLSFVEMLISLPGLHAEPRPRPVLWLSVYWALVPVGLLLLGLLGQLTG